MPKVRTTKAELAKTPAEVVRCYICDVVIPDKQPCVNVNLTEGPKVACLECAGVAKAMENKERAKRDEKRKAAEKNSSVG